MKLTYSKRDPVNNAYVKIWENKHEGMYYREEYLSFKLFDVYFTYYFNQIFTLIINDHIDLYNLTLYFPNSLTTFESFNHITLDRSFDIINEHLKKLKIKII